MSKFLLNLLVQISKALVYSKINFYSKRIFFRISAHPAQPRRPQATLAYFLKGVFSSTLRTPIEMPSLSHVTAMWGPPVSSIPFLTSADRCRFSSSSPATPRRLASPSDFARAITHPTIISPLNPPLNLAPVFNGVKAIHTTVTDPPCHPSPALPRPL
jgi:hypothetical protein